ncbi:13031_t:CDS:2, partial [Acaulospora colombiana]
MPCSLWSYKGLFIAYNVFDAHIFPLLSDIDTFWSLSGARILNCRQYDVSSAPFYELQLVLRVALICVELLPSDVSVRLANQENHCIKNSARLILTASLNAKVVDEIHLLHRNPGLWTADRPLH